MKRIIILISIASFAFLSCSQYEKIIIEDVAISNYKFEGTSKVLVDLSVKIYNGSNKNLSLKDIDFTLSNNRGVGLAHVVLLKSPPKIRPHSDNSYPVQLQVNLINLMALLSSGIDLQDPNIDNLLVNGKIKVKVGCLSHARAVKNQTVKDLVNSL